MKHLTIITILLLVFSLHALSQDDTKTYFYQAKPANNRTINVYKRPFSNIETELINKISSNETFTVEAGYKDGKCRKIFYGFNNTGWVLESDIEYLNNVLGFESIRLLNEISLSPDMISLEKIRPKKDQLKQEICNDYVIQVKTAKRGHDPKQEYLLIELRSTNPKSNLFTYRTGVIIVLDGVNYRTKKNAEIIYYQENGLYLDAIEMPVEYEDYMYKALNKISKLITGFDMDNVKDFLIAAGVGETEMPSFNNVQLDPINESITKYIGSYVHSNSLQHPKANCMQIAIHMRDGEMKNISNIYLMLGTYFSKAGRAIIFTNVLNTGVTHNANTEIQNGSFTDPRDGQTYKTVKIGEQVWMAENLNYNAGSGSWCYDDKSYNCDKYGRLYDWETACNVCPYGWHLPSDTEWKSLETELGMNKSELDQSGERGINEGCKLIENNEDIFFENYPEVHPNDINYSGFSALMAGLYYEGEYFDITLVTGFWSSTENETDLAWPRGLSCDDPVIARESVPKQIRMSVRCLKNN